MTVKVLRYYQDRGLRIARGYMQYVWDHEGARYVDAHTGHGVAFLGHSNPVIVSRVKRQLEELAVCSLSFDCEPRMEAAKAIASIAPPHLDTVAFANSGAEAVETALKMAWAYTGKSMVAAFKGSFHGRTLGALSVTWNPRYKAGFPVHDGVAFLDYNGDPGMVEDAIVKLSGSLAAVIVEPVLGEGGVIPASREFMRAVADAASKAGALLIVDEVQTGLGRTGRIWAHEYYGVKADILVTGKALGGGLPVSAVLAGDDVASKLEGGRHGSTHAGNPIAMAALAGAVEVVRTDDVASKAASAGERLRGELASRLQDARIVKGVRGLGLMLGVELRRDPGPVLKCMQDRGVLALKAGVSVVRLLPAYMLTPEDIEVVAGSLEACIGSASSG